MADEHDLAHLHRGEVDMVRRDLRAADLSGLDLSGRDFTGAHLERAVAVKTVFARATLQGAHLGGMRAPGADFSGIEGRQTVFFGMDLSGSSFKGAKVPRSHFQRCDFRGADLRGADFTGTRLNEGSKFDDCVVDETTRFDGAHIFRPLARLPAFRFYDVQRGILVRKAELNSAAAVTTEQEAAAQPPQDAEMRSQLVEAVNSALTSLEALPVASIDAATARIGHNNPPSDAALTKEDYDAVRLTLVELREAATAEPVDANLLRRHGERLAQQGEVILGWARDRYGEVQAGFFNFAGAALAAAIGAHLAFGSQLAAVLSKIGALLGAG